MGDRLTLSLGRSLYYGPRNELDKLTGTEERCKKTSTSNVTTYVVRSKKPNVERSTAWARKTGSFVSSFHRRMLIPMIFIVNEGVQRKLWKTERRGAI